MTNARCVGMVEADKMLLILNKKTHKVASVAEAQAIVNAKRTGKSTLWYGRNPGGAIVIAGNNAIARISYNGRAWMPDGATPYAGP